MSMIKTTTLMIVLLLSLTGCYNTGGEILWAEAVCQPHGGVDVLTTIPKAICADGTVIMRRDR